MRDGLIKSLVHQLARYKWTTYMLWLSRLMVNEKQQVIPSPVELGLGLLSVQLVSIAFCVLSKAIAPNFSQ
jgi:hypothetical protein